MLQRRLKIYKLTGSMTITPCSSHSKTHARINNTGKCLSYIRQNALWLVPIVVMIGITPFISYFDLWVAKCTYVNETNEAGRRISGFCSNAFFDFLYLYDVLPAPIIFVA